MTEMNLFALSHHRLWNPFLFAAAWSLILLGSGLLVVAFGPLLKDVAVPGTVTSGEDEHALRDHLLAVLFLALCGCLAILVGALLRRTARKHWFV